MKIILSSVAAIALCVLSAPLVTSCTQGAGSSTPAQAKASTPPPEALLGNWELVSETTAAGEAILKWIDAPKKVQLIFTDKEWQMIESDELTVRKVSKYGYNFENSEIKSTQADAATKVIDFGFISAGPEELKLRVPVVAPAGQFNYWTLKRIDTPQLAPNALKALEQTLDWTVTLADGKAQNFSGVATNPINWSNGASINCSYQSASTRDGKTTQMLFISYMVYRKSGEETLTAPQSPYFRAILPLTLNIEQETEQINVGQLAAASSVMGYAGNDDQAGFSSTLNPRCGLKGERNKRQLRIELSCANVGAMNSGVGAKLQAKATCTLL